MNCTAKRLFINLFLFFVRQLISTACYFLNQYIKINVPCQIQYYNALIVFMIEKLYKRQKNRFVAIQKMLTWICSSRQKQNKGYQIKILSQKTFVGHFVIGSKLQK